MPLETGTFINDLNADNPPGTDPKSQMDDHLRLIKALILATFPNLTGAMTMTHTELNTVTARGLIAGQTWTGNHTFPATTYGVTAAFGASGTAYATLDYVNAVATSAVLPGQTGNAGKIHTTNGTTSSWESFDDIVGYFKVSDQKASGTSGGASVAADITQTRILNTVEVNTITGASLASNTITLPAGTYRYKARAPAYNSAGNHKCFLYNVTDAAYTGIGSNSVAVGGGAVGMTDSNVTGQFTIASSKDFTLRHYTANALAGSGLGNGLTTGQVEVYTEAEFWKVG